MEPNGALDALLKEERVFRPSPQTLIEANLKPDEYEAALELAGRDYKAYWERAAEELDWFRKWDRVLNDDEFPVCSWFEGAKCNIVYNALDRHIFSANKNKLALIWEGEAGDCRKFTYYDLQREVNRFANALRSLGVKKGDRIVLYMPPLPETVVAMLAAAKIGAVHSLVFAGFSAKFLRRRIDDVRARLVVTADGFYRGGRIINLKNIVDEALLGVRGDCAETVVVVNRANTGIEMQSPRDIPYQDLVRRESTEFQTEVMDSSDPLFLLYTSGTTGAPKPVAHCHGGYMVGVHHTFTRVFDSKATDIYWCAADPGWITGHSYGVYGPFCAGATTIMYEGHPLYPQADRPWSIVDRHGATIFYTTPTLIRMLMRYGARHAERHDLSSLRLLGSVGEPINPEAWMWLHKHIGRSRCPVLDTWWQTETGMAMISPLPISLLKPGSVGRPLPGVSADIVDKNGDPVPPGKGGFLVLDKPWPAMMTVAAGDEEVRKGSWFEKFPGRWFTGDAARRDQDGYFWIQGRVDDVLNIAGRRVGAAEIEAALASHKAVIEAAVIGVPDKIKGEVAKAFVLRAEDWESLFENEDELRADLKRHVRRELGSVVSLRTVEFRETLPRTRSGKIMRRVLKAEELGRDLGDVSTLED